MTDTCVIKVGKEVVAKEEVSFDLPPKCTKLYETKLLKRNAKCAVYLALSKWQNKTMPWGTLTGIRPTRLAHELIEDGVPEHLIKETLMKSFYVSEKKADIVAKTIKNQRCIIKNDNLIDIYINISVLPNEMSILLVYFI